MDPAVASQPDPRDDDRVARLTRDLADAIEQQTATSEVLETIGRSAFELEPVFETVVRHAVRLCGADAGLRLPARRRRLPARGRARRVRRSTAATSPSTRSRAAPGTLVGRVGLERRTVQIADARVRPGYQWQRGARARRVPHDARRPDARRRPRRRRDRALARRGRAVRRPHDRARDDVRRPGRDRDPERPALPRAPAAQRRARALGRRAAGARRGQPGGQLQPRPRRGARRRS